MAKPSDAMLDRWIADSWDTPPPWTRSAFREYHDAEMREVARAKVASAEAKENAELRKQNRALARRVTQLEKIVGRNGKGLADPIIGALAQAVPQVVHQIIEQRMCLRFTGIWDDQKEYAPGAAVTYAGAVWTATGHPAKGERPSKGAHWRLIAKGEPKEPTVR